MPRSPGYKEKMFSVIEQWKDSGLSQREFIDQAGVSKWKFYYWLNKYRNKGSEEKKFIPVNTGPSRPGSFIEIRWPNGVEMKVPSGTSVDTLKSLAGIS